MTPWATPPSVKPANAAHSAPAAAAAGEPGALDRDGGERADGQRARGHAPGEADGAGDHAERPARDEHAEGGVAGAEHVLDEEHLGRDRDGEEQQRGDGGGQRDAQDAVGGQEGEPVARAPAVAGARAAARGSRRACIAAARGDGEERRRVDQQRDLEQPGRGERAAGSGPTVMPA